MIHNTNNNNTNNNNNISSTENVCPLFPHRQLSNDNVTPLEVEDLKLPTFQQYGRTVLNTDTLYKNLRKMHCQGRITSLRPTILISTKPHTNEINTNTPQKSIVMNEMEKDIIRDNEMEKVNDRMVVKEISDGLVVVNQQNQTQIQQPFLSNPLSSTMGVLQNGYPDHSDEMTNLNDDGDLKKSDDHVQQNEETESALFFSAEKASYEYESKVDDQRTNDDFDSNDQSEMEVAVLTETSTISPSNYLSSSFSLHQLSTMLMALLMARSIQNTSNQQTTVENENKSHMEFVMISVALM